MNETPFYRTQMGKHFYERTVPGLLRALERLAAAVEKLGDRDHDDATKDGE